MPRQRPCTLCSLSRLSHWEPNRKTHWAPIRKTRCRPTRCGNGGGFPVGFLGRTSARGGIAKPTWAGRGPENGAGHGKPLPVGSFRRCSCPQLQISAPSPSKSTSAGIVETPYFSMRAKPCRPVALSCIIAAHGISTKCRSVSLASLHRETRTISNGGMFLFASVQWARVLACSFLSSGVKSLQGWHQSALKYRLTTVRPRTTVSVVANLSHREYPWESWIVRKPLSYVIQCSSRVSASAVLRLIGR